MHVRHISIYGSGLFIRFSVCPVSALMIPKISNVLKFAYSAMEIVWGGIMITATTRANQSFFSGKL